MNILEVKTVLHITLRLTLLTVLCAGWANADLFSVAAVAIPNKTFACLGEIPGFASTSPDPGAGSSISGGPLFTAPGAGSTQGADSSAGATESSGGSIDGGNLPTPQWVSTNLSQPTTFPAMAQDTFVPTGDLTDFGNTFRRFEEANPTYVPHGSTEYVEVSDGTNHNDPGEVAVDWNSFGEDGGPPITEKSRRIVPLPFAATPEPSSLALLATVVAVVWRVRRKLPRQRFGAIAGRIDVSAKVSRMPGHRGRVTAQ